jgi:hypothetical protein
MKKMNLLLKEECLREMIEKNETTIRLELALLRDIGLPMINFCYTREGDSFLSPTTFELWESMVKSVTNVCDNLNPICPAVGW